MSSSRSLNEMRLNFMCRLLCVITKYFSLERLWDRDVNATCLDNLLSISPLKKRNQKKVVIRFSALRTAQLLSGLLREEESHTRTPEFHFATFLISFTAQR